MKKIAFFFVLSIFVSSVASAGPAQVIENLFSRLSRANERSLTNWSHQPDAVRGVGSSMFRRFPRDASRVHGHGGVIAVRSAQGEGRFAGSVVYQIDMAIHVPKTADTFMVDAAATQQLARDIAADVYSQFGRRVSHFWTPSEDGASVVIRFDNSPDVSRFERVMRQAEGRMQRAVAASSSNAVE